MINFAANLQKNFDICKKSINFAAKMTKTKKLTLKEIHHETRNSTLSIDFCSYRLNAGVVLSGMALVRCP